MEKISNLKIFATNITDQTMELKSFYHDYKDEIYKEIESCDNKTRLKAIKQRFLQSRIDAGLKYGFDGKKIVVPKGSGFNGNYFVADEDIYAKKDDLMDFKFSSDIVLLKEDNPGIVIAYPVSDDPVLIIEDQDKRICALAHCDVDKISNRIPECTVNALSLEAGSKVENLKVYIGPHLKKESNLVLIKPKSIKDNASVWKGCISKKNKNKVSKSKRKFIDFIYDLFRHKIDQEKAIVNMLLKMGIKEENITVSDINTYNSIYYYSSLFASDYREPSLEGKFLVGAYYSDTFPEYEDSSYVRSL